MKPRVMLCRTERGSSCFSTSFCILGHHELHLELALGLPTQYQSGHMRGLRGQVVAEGCD